MKGYVLDGCTLINLYCAWGSIANLNCFPAPFHIGTAVASEVHYVRDFDSKGNVVAKNLSAIELARHHPLHELAPTSEEIELMVRLSAWLDDGEAQGLAIAASRSMEFCTDDGAVQKVVAALGIQTNLASTPSLLLAWAGNEPHRLGTLPTMVKRITELGRFRPHHSSPHYSWWMNKLDES